MRKNHKVYSLTPIVHTKGGKWFSYLPVDPSSSSSPLSLFSLLEENSKESQEKKQNEGKKRTNASTLFVKPDTFAHSIWQVDSKATKGLASSDSLRSFQTRYSFFSPSSSSSSSSSWKKERKRQKKRRKRKKEKQRMKKDKHDSGRSR